MPAPLGSRRAPHSTALQKLGIRSPCSALHGLLPPASPLATAHTCGNRVPRRLLGRPQPQRHNGWRNQHQRRHALRAADHTLCRCGSAHGVSHKNALVLRGLARRRRPAAGRRRGGRRGAAAAAAAAAVPAAAVALGCKAVQAAAATAAAAAGSGDGVRAPLPLLLCLLRLLCCKLCIQDAAGRIAVEVKRVIRWTAGPAGQAGNKGRSAGVYGTPAALASCKVKWVQLSDVHSKRQRRGRRHRGSSAVVRQPRQAGGRQAAPTAG